MVAEQHIISAPDHSKAAVFTYAGEIRFGPPYFSLRIGPYDFGERMFGREFLWSEDSRFFAVQEWLTTDEATGPRTQLLIIEPAENRECAVSRAEKGFIEPKAFEADRVIYTKTYLAGGLKREFESSFLELPRWRPIAKHGQRKKPDSHPA